MEQIFEQAKDLHVVATMVYGNGDEYAYADAECTKKFTGKELQEVFIKGALIEVEGTLYKAVAFNLDESGIGAIVYVTAGAGAEGPEGISLGVLKTDIAEESNDRVNM